MTWLPRFKLLDEWWIIAVHSWSSILMSICNFLLLLELGLPLLDLIENPPLWLKALTLIVGLLAQSARYFKQYKLQDKIDIAKAKNDFEPTKPE